MEELKHEKGTKEAITELKSLIQGQRANSNYPNNKGISGSLADRITEMLISGKERKSETDLKIGNIKKALKDFAKQNKNKDKENNTRKRENEYKNKSGI